MYNQPPSWVFFRLWAVCHIPSIPHLGWKGVRGVGKKVRIPSPSTLFLILRSKGEGGGVEIPTPSVLTPSVLIPYPGVEGGRGEEWEFQFRALYSSPWGRGVGISTPNTLFFTLGLKGVGGRSGNSNSEHSSPHLGVEGGRRGVGRGDV